VRFLLGLCAIKLLERGTGHDASKLAEPEKAIFDVVGNRLAVITYQGEDYKQSLEDLKRRLIITISTIATLRDSLRLLLVTPAHVPRQTAGRRRESYHRLERS
jgi:hypothetical protein